jgi:hypothetical protein
MAYHPEDVGSKPTAGIYSFIVRFTEMRYNASCILLPSGLDLVKHSFIDHLAARSKLALRLFF